MKKEEKICESCRGKNRHWTIALYPNGAYERIPEDDIKEHLMGSGICPCKTTVSVEKGITTWNHVPYDGIE